MMTYPTKSALIRSWVELVWNQNKFDTLPQFHPPQFLNEGHPSTNEQAQAWHERMRAVYPDLTYSTDELSEAEQHVTVRWSATGTHKGQLWGLIPPSDKQIQWRGIHLLSETKCLLLIKRRLLTSFPRGSEAYLL